MQILRVSFLLDVRICVLVSNKISEPSHTDLSVQPSIQPKLVQICMLVPSAYSGVPPYLTNTVEAGSHSTEEGTCALMRLNL